MIPTHVNPSWKTLRSTSKIDVEALFLLRDDKANYNAQHEAPFVVMSNGECNPPKLCGKPVTNVFSVYIGSVPLTLGKFLSESGWSIF